MEYKINNGTNSDRCKPRLKIRYVTGKRNNAASMHDRWLQFGISDMDIDTSDLTRPDVYRSSHDWVGSGQATPVLFRHQRTFPSSRTSARSRKIALASAFQIMG